MPGRFFLDCDGDGHWYLVPDDKRGEWEAWTLIPEDDEASWETPAFARSLGCSYNYVTFTDPVVG